MAENPESVSRDTVTPLNGTRPSGSILVVDGIAEAADGTVYVDTSYGDGFN